MNHWINGAIIAGVTCCAARVTQAEVGVNIGSSHNCKVSFGNDSYSLQSSATDPGTDPAVSGAQDRYYDDGTVLTDSIPGAPGLTRFYAFDDQATQVVNSAAGGGTITMTSQELFMDAGSDSVEQDDGDVLEFPSIELYWREALVEKERWSADIRAALRWNHVAFDSRSVQGSTYQVTSDTYTFGFNNILLPGSYDGTVAPSGGYPSLDDVPTRTLTQTAGSSVVVNRDLDAEIFALDIGPALTFDLTEKLRLTASVGGTAAYVFSELSYADGFSRDSDHDSEALFGWYANADLQYQCGERWGLSAGAGFYDMETYTHKAESHSAQLDFEDYYTLRFGLY
jgi:hypothetical protein